MNSPSTEAPRPPTPHNEVPAPESYARLGPGADVTLAGPDAPPAGPRPNPKRIRTAQLIAIASGIISALVAAHIGNMTRSSQQSRRAISDSGPRNFSRVDRMKAQQQAETLLEQAIGNSPEAIQEISNRADEWNGKLSWDSKIANLTTTALNSRDLRVLEAGVEVQIAAYRVNKDSSSVDSLTQQANSSEHANKIWALWALGLLANRGIETDRIVQTLTEHLNDKDEDSRRWAVESLALAGGSSTIAPLLRAMHDDPAPIVRERAACGLAESGLFTHEQRMSAVPQLLSYSDDPSLDAQTHAWAFQALGDITQQHLPNDSAAWRNWYENSPHSD